MICRLLSMLPALPQRLCKKAVSLLIAEDCLARSTDPDPIFYSRHKQELPLHEIDHLHRPMLSGALSGALCASGWSDLYLPLLVSIVQGLIYSIGGVSQYMSLLHMCLLVTVVEVLSAKV